MKIVHTLMVAFFAAESTVALAVGKDFCVESDYRAPLRVGEKTLIPFGGIHDMMILPGGFGGDPHGRDVLAEGTLFGSDRRLFRFLRMEDGVPVYSRGERMPDAPDPRAADHRCRFDVDGDGIADRVTADCSYKGSKSGWPWAGLNPWNGIESPYSGIARGYDIFGRWLGYETICEFFWEKGEKDADGNVSFGAKRNILQETPGFEALKGLRKALTWKCFNGVWALCVLQTKGGRWLVIHGDVNALVALPITVRNGEAYCGEARPLLKSGYRLERGYYLHGLYPVDLDLDGQDELLADGNPGVLGYYKGTEPGDFINDSARIEGGDLCGETVVVPSRYDWDGDGTADIILADATGRLTFWGGTDDPYVFRKPRSFTHDGRPWLVTGGENGSLQGVWERCWGYVSPTAGRWQGKNAIVTVDTRGDLVMRVPQDGDPFELRDAPFRNPNGTQYKTAWRCRADFVYATTRFASVPHDSFLLQDLDGDAALAIPRTDGGFVIGETRKLAYADGSNIRLCGINGLWGRACLTLVDWDMDGKLDFLVSSDRACQKFWRPDMKEAEAEPFLFRNVGTNERPLFAKGVPFRLKKNGKRLCFESHIAATTIGDFNGDGRPDVMIGAENGKVYPFEHDEIFVSSSDETGSLNEDCEVNGATWIRQF